MANVSVSGIEGTASEIQGVNDILKNTATNTSTAGDRISKLATEFASYNNQISADNPPHYEQYTEGDSICTYNIYDTWVTTTGGLESRAASLASKADEINSVVDRISSKVADVQTIAVAIQGYIDSIQDILSNSDTMSKCGINLSSGVVASAFLALGRDGVAKANLATSGADINSRNFLDYDNIKDDEKLNGGLLSFEKQDDGSYLIKKDGESTGYYTTGLAAGLYMKTLVNGATAKEKEKVKNSTNIDDNQEKFPLKGEEALNNVKKGFSSIVDETQDNAQNLKMSISAKDLSGETRTIDEFKPTRTPDSVSTVRGTTTETYLMDNGNKLIFEKSGLSQIMSVVDKKDYPLARRFFDKSGKQSTLYLYNYNKDEYYTVQNGKLIYRGKISD